MNAHNIKQSVTILKMSLYIYIPNNSELAFENLYKFTLFCTVYCSYSNFHVKPFLVFDLALTFSGCYSYISDTIWHMASERWDKNSWLFIEIQRRSTAYTKRNRHVCTSWRKGIYQNANSQFATFITLIFH